MLFQIFPPKQINFSPASLFSQGNPNYCFIYPSPKIPWLSKMTSSRKDFQRQGRLKYRIKKRPLSLDGMEYQDHFPASQERETLVGKTMPAVAHSSALKPSVRKGGGPTRLAKGWRRECGGVQEACFQKRYFGNSFPSQFPGFYTSYFRNCQSSVFLVFLIQSFK